jgi:drug/metabolite transporter (DMT)-like permease
MQPLTATAPDAPAPSSPQLLVGTGFALGAGLLWGLVFIAPLLLPQYPAALLSAARYLAFGLIALPLAWLDRAHLRQLCRADWLEALKLSAVGNLLYYLFLAAAIQRAGAPLPTMIIGTLPVVIAVCANLRDAQRDGYLPWRSLLPCLALIALGIGLVNHEELSRWEGSAAGTGGASSRYLEGAALAVGAVLCWTWYPLRNADWLRAHPDRQPRAWATAQGLATLPLSALAFGAFWLWNAQRSEPFPMPWGPEPALFVSLMLAIGLLASWLGTLCWNEASQRLPTSLAGQLIVFETLAALAYAFTLRGQWPGPWTALGIGLLVLGVLWALRVKPRALQAKAQAKTQV